MNDIDKLKYEQDLLSQNNSSFNLLRNRVGAVIPSDGFEGSYIDGINDLSHYLNQKGGFTQQERMVRDKRKSLDKALLYSYQGAVVKKYSSEEENDNKVIRALINPNKLKQDYDDKIISIGYEHNFNCGDVFEWIGTHTYWLIYLQDLTELAYFRGDIRKCQYEIKWKDSNGLHKTFAAVRGPVETKINYIQKHQISIDEPNYSLNILLPKNEETLSYFKRYSKFYLSNQDSNDSICWRVEAIDWISTPGILEINAVEYYSNKDEDNIEEGIAGDLIIDKVNPNNDNIETTIIGETFIKPRRQYEYIYNGSRYYNWKIDNKYPIKYEIDKTNRNKIYITWTSSYSGQFILTYGNISKTIVVESLF